MASGVKVAGSWSPFANVHAKVAGTWQGCSKVYAKVAGTWQVVWQALTVAMPDVTNNQSEIGVTVRAGVQVNSDGDWYQSDNVGNYSAAGGTWLTAGANSDVWVERTINSETGTGLDVDDIGASRVAMTTTRELRVSRTSTGVSSANVTLTFYDAASGGNVLDTATIILEAEQTSGA